MLNAQLNFSLLSRARSIYERALDVDYRNVTLWLKYAEMEMKNRQVNHARNIWDRAITTLPRVNQFWYVYREWNISFTPKEIFCFVLFWHHAKVHCLLFLQFFRLARGKGLVLE